MDLSSILKQPDIPSCRRLLPYYWRRGSFAKRRRSVHAGAADYRGGKVYYGTIWIHARWPSRPLHVRKVHCGVCDEHRAQRRACIPRANRNSLVHFRFNRSSGVSFGLRRALRCIHVWTPKAAESPPQTRRVGFDHCADAPFLSSEIHGRAHEIALAELDAAMAQDVIRRCAVEIEVR